MSYIKECDKVIREKVKDGTLFKKYLNAFGNYDAEIVPVLKKLGYQEVTDNSLKKFCLKVLAGFNQGYGYNNPYFEYYAHPSVLPLQIKNNVKKYSNMTVDEIREFFYIDKAKSFSLGKHNSNTFLVHKENKQYKSYSELLMSNFGTKNKTIARFVSLGHVFNFDEDCVFYKTNISETIEKKYSALSTLKDFFSKGHKTNVNDFYKWLDSSHLVRSSYPQFNKIMLDEVMDRLGCSYTLQDVCLLSQDNQDTLNLANTLIPDIHEMLPEKDTRDDALMQRWIKNFKKKNDLPLLSFLSKFHTYQINKMVRKEGSKPKEDDNYKYSNVIGLDSYVSNLTFISTPKEQRSHGRKMRHCIGSQSYINSCKKGTHSIYEYKQTDEANKATVNYTFFIDNNKKIISQCKGKFNSDVPVKIIKEIELALSKI